MKNIIKTSKGKYTYTPMELHYGRKLINLEVSKKNLLDFKIVMDTLNLEFGLIYGTLLGAVREKNFIKHDEDVDLFMKNNDKENFLDSLFKLKEIGFEVVRYDGYLLSIMRDEDYIDIYFFKKNMLGKWVSNGHVLEDNFLDNYQKISFLGQTFNIPDDYLLFLVACYGDDWKTPKKNAPADVHKGLSKVLLHIKKLLPQSIINILKQIRNKLRGI